MSSIQHKREGMDMVVKIVTHWLKGFICLFGVYLAMCSHESPGGGFAGGVVIACVFVLITLAEGQRVAIGILGKGLAAIIGSAAALGLLVILTLLCIRGDIAPITNNLRVSLMQLCDLCIAFVVATVVFVAFSVMAATHVQVKGDKRRMIFRGRGGE